MQAKGGKQEKAGPSHDDWPALPMAPMTPGTKRGPPSQSPKKVAAKVAHRLSVQQLQGQLQPGRVYLPSAPSSMKYCQTSNKSVTSLGQERDRLGREVRAAEVLYTATGPEGQRLSVLMQPAQASGIAALPVPQIQPQELHLRNAGATLRDQAMVQNLIVFGEREREKKEQSGSTEVAALTSTIGGTTPMAPKPTAEQRQVDADMDTGKQSNGKTVEEAEAQQPGQQPESSGLATKDASQA